MEDARRAAEHGFRSVLVADLGVLAAFDAMRRAGALPAEMQAKVSVMLPVANPAAAQVIERLGANTLNLPTDLTLPRIAAIRAAITIPLDIYVEAPDSLGGFIRLHEIPEIIRVASPVYLKFGLRNAPDIYPSGSHLESTAVALSRERVRRARLGLDLLKRSGMEAHMSQPALGRANRLTSTPASAAIRAISSSSASVCRKTPLPWETRWMGTDSRLASSRTARRQAGPSVLGISTRYWAPSGKRLGESGTACRSPPGRPMATSTSAADDVTPTSPLAQARPSRLHCPCFEGCRKQPRNAPAGTGG